MNDQKPSYRWNTSDAAEAYDQAAPAIHPYYETIQNEIQRLLPFESDTAFVAVDLGGGSGRLAERVLTQFTAAEIVVVDQSGPFLAIAERRLGRFPLRASFIRSRLQDDWGAKLPAAADVILSTSAIHHLDAEEKRALFARCLAALKPGGTFINGDEHRPASDAEFLALLRKWSQHMYSALQSGRIPASFRQTLDQWQERNIGRFGEPKKSGDDCLETIEAQLQHLRDAGFSSTDAIWTNELWAVVAASK